MPKIFTLMDAEMKSFCSPYYPWGWAADRYGGRRIILISLCGTLLFPLSWMLVPRVAPVNLYVAAGLSLAGALIGAGFAMGAGRLLFVTVVPREKATEYMAAYYAGWGW